MLPLLHLQDLDSCGFPDDVSPLFQSCLLQILEPAVLVTRPPHATVSLPIALSNASILAPGTADIHWSPRFDPTPVVRGHHVGVVAAAIPRSMTERVHVFVDPRPLCMPIRVVASKQGPMPLSAFLLHVGMDLPWQNDLEVRGTVPFNVRNRCVYIRPGDPVVLSYARAAQLKLQEALRARMNVPRGDESVAPPTADGARV